MQNNSKTHISTGQDFWTIIINPGVRASERAVMKTFCMSTVHKQYAVSIIQNYQKNLKYLRIFKILVYLHQTGRLFLLSSSILEKLCWPQRIVGNIINHRYFEGVFSKFLPAFEIKSSYHLLLIKICVLLLQMLTILLIERAPDNGSINSAILKLM